MNRILITLALFLLVSCGSIKDAGKVLRNEKANSTDEFLVKKRNPLVLPPNYDQIPEPGSIISNKKSNEDTFKKILKAPVMESQKKIESSSIEESILNRIRK